jgi:Xaa-Pro aminopeptidase
MLLNREKANQLMEAKGVDALLLCYTENVMYFSDFMHVNSNTIKLRLYYLLYFRSEQHAPVFLVPHQDFEDAKRHTWITDVRPTSEFSIPGREGVIVDKVGEIAGILDDYGLRGCRLGYEEMSLPVNVFEDLNRRSGAELVPCSELIFHLRAVKSPEELRRIREAMRLTEAGAAAIRDNIRIGITEIELADHAKDAILREGGNAPDFLIVAAAANGAIVHGAPTDYRLQDGDLIRFDLGVSHDGYAGDFARTYAVGKNPSPENARRYEGVYHAVQAGIAAVKPGATADEIFWAEMNAGRKIIPELTREHAGHGLGLEVHEEPMIYSGNTFTLEEGMLVMIENGLYLKGTGGYQLEDLILVTATGGESITTLSRDLVIG